MDFCRCLVINSTLFQGDDQIVMVAENAEDFCYIVKKLTSNYDIAGISLVKSEYISVATIDNTVPKGIEDYRYLGELFNKNGNSSFRKEIVDMIDEGRRVIGNLI